MKSEYETQLQTDKQEREKLTTQFKNLEIQVNDER